MPGHVSKMSIISQTRLKNAMDETAQSVIERNLSSEFLHELQKIYFFVSSSSMPAARSSLPSKHTRTDTRRQDVQFEIDI
jgi:uncharacterized protein (UPF0262 family)